MLSNIYWRIFMQRWRFGLRAPWLPTLPAIFLVAGLLAGCSGGSDLSFPTEYQAVFLDNGQVFFGKLGEGGSDYLTLRDVYYIQRQVAPEKKETRNLLVRLGSEWHAPDFMRINNRHIVFIEPVAPDSQVVRLIREAKTLPAAAPPGQAPAPAAAPPAPTPPAAAPRPERKPAGR
jgi:hypothetical protein